MDFRDYLRVLRRRWYVVALLGLLAPAAALVVALLMTPTYTASTQLFFAVQGGGTVTDLAQGSTYTEQQMGSYAKVAVSPLVLQPVVKSLGLTETAVELGRSVTAQALPDTVILEIDVTDPDPQQAALVANAIGKQLSSVTGSLVPDGQDGSSSVRATTLAQAVVPTKPSSPNLPELVGVALLVGLLLGVAVAMIRHFTDSKIRNEQDVKTLTDTPVVGAVPLDPAAARLVLAADADPLGARSMALHRLQINLQLLNTADDRKAIVITSSVPGEGKTSTAINLAATAARAGRRVLLVDADLRQPSVADQLGLDPRQGLSTLLLGDGEFADLVQRAGREPFDVLPAGPVVENSAELLGSTGMFELLPEISARYDLVVVDTSPLLPVPDAIAFSRSAAGMLLVVGADRLRRPELVEALQSLSLAHAKVVGVVLNKVAKRDVPSYAPSRRVGFDWTLPDETRAEPKAQPPAGGRGLRRNPAN